MSIVKTINENQNFNNVRDLNFSYYIRTLNLEDDSNVLVLSPVHHYYYNFDEIKDVRTLVHMKELNKVTDLKGFIVNTTHVLSNDSKFIGCFKDNLIHKNILYRSRIIHWLSHCLEDGNIYRSLSRKRMIKMFSKHRFEVLDMSEIDGLTYFCVKK
jgi:hypothetical protein